MKTLGLNFLRKINNVYNEQTRKETNLKKNPTKPLTDTKSNKTTVLNVFCGRFLKSHETE